jgi:hypothetical protein
MCSFWPGWILDPACHAPSQSRASVSLSSLPANVCACIPSLKQHPAEDAEPMQHYTPNPTLDTLNPTEPRCAGNLARWLD